MSNAAVGSISHILKTAFKDVYEDHQHRIDAAIAREQKKLRDIEEARIAEENARLAALKEEEDALAAAEAAKEALKSKPKGKK